LKVLRSDLVRKKSMAKRFLLEAKATSRLTNPHTVTIFDYGKTDDGLLYIAMEYLRGRTLLAKIEEEGTLSVDETIRVACEMAESLAEAHSHQIVHRDLKPENVLLVETSTEKDFVKVLDFGIAHARPISGDMTLTRTGQLSGTPPYMSPEIIRGKTIDARADVYSMGIMIYQMLSGRCPFRGDTPFDIFMKHVQEKPPTLKEMGVEVSPALQRFLDRCLAKDVKKRPKDAEAFLGELRKLVGTESRPHVHARMASEHTSHDMQSLSIKGVQIPELKSEPTDVYPATGTRLGGLGRGRYGPKTASFVISRIRRTPRIWATITGLLIAALLAAIVTEKVEVESQVPASTRSADKNIRMKTNPSKIALPIERQLKSPDFKRPGEAILSTDLTSSSAIISPESKAAMEVDGVDRLPVIEHGLPAKAVVESVNRPRVNRVNPRSRAEVNSGMVVSRPPQEKMPDVKKEAPRPVITKKMEVSLPKRIQPVSKIDALLD
jgi:serine/threonine protein kinase